MVKTKESARGNLTCAATKAEQPNVEQHSENPFQIIVETGLKNGGIHVNASKNHGKSRLLFSMSKHLRNLENCRVLIFDGSEAWLYGYDAIPTFTVQERNIVLINDVQTTEEIERYQLTNWSLIELALKTHKDLLFRLKTRKPSKRGFFIRTVINYMDALQRTERETTPNHEPKQYIGFFIEEAQDAFNSRSTTRLESEEFLTVFNEARNQREAFYTASQRLTDFSKTIRTKQLYCLGKINEEDKINGLRRLEKLHNIDFSKIPQRHWFFEGALFESPEWKQNGKPYQINREVKKLRMANLKPQPKEHLVKRAIKTVAAIFNAVFGSPKPHVWTQTGKAVVSAETREMSEDNEDNEDYVCPNCGQSCTKEEAENGFCLDCDQLELFNDFEE